MHARVNARAAGTVMQKQCHYNISSDYIAVLYLHVLIITAESVYVGEKIIKSTGCKVC